MGQFPGLFPAVSLGFLAWAATTPLSVTDGPWMTVLLLPALLGSSTWGAGGLHSVSAGHCPCLCCGPPHLLACSPSWSSLALNCSLTKILVNYVGAAAWWKTDENFDGLTTRNALVLWHGRLIGWIPSFFFFLHAPVTTQTVFQVFQLLSLNALPCCKTNMISTIRSNHPHYFS